MPDGVYPVTYSIQRPQAYNRWTVGFRAILAIPQYLIVGGLAVPAVAPLVYSGGHGPGFVTQVQGISALLGLLALFAWVVIMLREHYPASIRSTAEMFFRWTQNVAAYINLQAEPYPPFGAGPYALEIGIEPADRYNRWTVFFRLILVIPHFVVLFFLGIAQFIVTVIAWFAILFTGQYPESMYDFSVGVSRWGARVSAYLYLFVDEYPPFTLEAGPSAAAANPETA